MFAGMKLLKYPNTGYYSIEQKKMSRSFKIEEIKPMEMHKGAEEVYSEGDEQVYFLLYKNI